MSYKMAVTLSILKDRKMRHHEESELLGLRRLPAKGT